MEAITIIVGFLNTLNLTSGHDTLAGAESFWAWLSVALHDATGPASSLQDMAWTIEFREALRDLASANSGRRPTAAAAEVVTRTARMVGVSLSFGGDGSPRLASSASGLEGAVADILVGVHGMMSDGSWSRLKICRNPECRWAFYDNSRNHSRVWCAMKECGNKMKARRFRQRSKEARSVGDPSSGQK